MLSSCARADTLPLERFCFLGLGSSPGCWGVRAPRRLSPAAAPARAPLLAFTLSLGRDSAGLGLFSASRLPSSLSSSLPSSSSPSSLPCPRDRGPSCASSREAVSSSSMSSSVSSSSSSSSSTSLLFASSFSPSPSSLSFLPPLARFHP